MNAHVRCGQERAVKRAEGTQSTLWQITMKVDADARDMPIAPQPVAQPGTPIASNTDSPVSSLEGLLVQD